MKNEALYGWLFHYNIYKELWFAFKREDSIAYFNGDKTIETYSSDKMSTIESYILYENKEVKN